MDLKLYKIRLCRREEYKKLVDFLRKYWDKNHVFCRNREIFEFQHGDASNGEYDFIVAVHNETNEIHAVLGFISTSRYDGKDAENPEAVFGALWKTRNDIYNNEIGKLGLGVLYFLLKKFPNSAYITLGLSKFSQKIYSALHFDFGVMSHYYIASKYTLQFCIAENPFVNKHSKINNDYSLEEMEDVPMDFSSVYYPNKNREYIKKRYINHPFYKYKLIGVFRYKKVAAIWITRFVDMDGKRCIRIVDIIGNMEGVKNIEGNIHVFLQKYDAEYIDCYNYGIDKKVFFNAGFAIVEDNVVIPNYFEPFEKKSIIIHYAALSKRPIAIFKGDCDQDRPNLLDS